VKLKRRDAARAEPKQSEPAPPESAPERAMDRGPGGRSNRWGWRTLGRVWAVLLTLGLGGAIALESMGSPEAARVAEPAPTAPAQPAGPPAEAHAAAQVAHPVAAPAPSPRPVVSPPSPVDPPSGNNPTTRLALPTPDEALLEKTPRGMLPIVAPDERLARILYSRPFSANDPRVKVAVVIDGLGVSDALTEEWMARLPPAFTLAFSPYGRRLAGHAEAARTKGFETLIGLPLEPVNFPLNDPGPMALLTFEPWGVNRDRMHWALAQLRGYVGAVGSIGGLRGERFAAAREAIGPVIDELEARGLFFLDARAGAEPARATARAIDLVLDEPAVRSETEAKLAQLERLARERGTAVGLLQARPLMLEIVTAWAGTLAGREVLLAPLSAMMPAPRVPRPKLEAISPPPSAGSLLGPAAAPAAVKPASDGH